jgi:hypothetical protein
LIAYFEMSFILGHVAPLMRVRQYTPDFGLYTKRVLQTLKNDIAIIRTIPMPTQGR